MRACCVQGVLGMAWSTYDSSLLLSSGKDNCTICWDVQTADKVCELSTNNWNFDVQVRCREIDVVLSECCTA